MAKMSSQFPFEDTQRSCMLRICLVATSITCFAVQALGALTIAELGDSNSPAPKYDRFLNDPTFIGSAFDWSGVGRGLNGDWATMISPSYFVSATHFNPGNHGESTLRFYYTNNPDGPPEATYEDHTFAPVGQIAGSDLWLGRLAAPVSNRIATYPIISLASDSTYANRAIYVFGLTSATPGNATTVRLGTNNIDAANAAVEPPQTIAQVTVGDSAGYTFTFDYDASRGGSESMLQSGDSGAPDFSIVNGNLPALVGINWFQFDDSSGSGSTFVPGYISELRAAMSDEKLTIVADPAIKGDFNLDGRVSAADVQAMLLALTNLEAYTAQHHINSDYLLQIGDLDNNGMVTNSDIQALLTLVSGGTGAVSVPEPSGLTLMLFCIVTFLSDARCPWPSTFRHSHFG